MSPPHSFRLRTWLVPFLLSPSEMWRSWALRWGSRPWFSSNPSRLNGSWPRLLLWLLSYSCCPGHPMHASRSSPGLGKYTEPRWYLGQSRTPADWWKIQKESAGNSEDVRVCSFPDMEASWIPTLKLSRLLSPRRQPSTTLSSMQSFIPNIGEGSRAPQQSPQLRKQDAQIAEFWLFPTGTRWQRKFPVCTSCPRRPGGSASQCPRVNPPSGTPYWADTRQAPNPGSTGWCPCLRQTRSVPVLMLPWTQYWCHHCLFWGYFGSREAAEKVLFLLLRLQHIWHDVELDPISHPRKASYSLGALKDREYKSGATLPEEKGS